jgi:uncharacterized protein YecA (UPF0149 family)
MVTDPQSKSINGFPALSPEVEAISGRMLAAQKEAPTPEPAAENAEIVHPANIAEPAQECTKPTPIRVAPQPGRNSPCPCGSHLKFKRCCANSIPITAKTAA